ncbi:sorbitol dehydrogenase [Ruminococcus sp. AF14-10]|nr:sorbitol dehydrogenase [Ruminococcus sp. AF14-10]
MAKGKLIAVKDYMDVDIREYDVPEPLEDGLVIKIEAAAICGSDIGTMNMKGYPRNFAGNIGHEFTGKVIAMGEKAKTSVKCFNGELEVGDRIAIYPWITCGHCKGCLRFGVGTCGACEEGFIYGGDEMYINDTLNHNPDIYPHFKGGFGEYVHIFAGTYVWKLPEGMPSKIAALLDPMAVAMRAVEQAMTTIGGLHEGISTTTRALVVGPGPIGIMTGMILKRMGVELLVMTGRNDNKLKKAQEICGADVTINVKEMSLEEKIAKVEEVTGGGADVVINCASAPDSAIEAMMMTGFLGTYVEVGNAGAWTHEPKLTLNLPDVIFGKNIHVTSVVANTAQCFDRAFRLLTKYEELPFEKLITHEFHGLEEFVPTVKHGHDEDYIKGVLIFED